MRNHGHEDARIPVSEIERRRLDALIYREYDDPAYTIPITYPLIATDINEPQSSRRIPGTVLYTAPGERLRVHVLNGDVEPRSLHVHGLAYGIDSDGTWPLGVMAADGRRSDAICPGQTWRYVFDVTDDMVGAWPFHDHHMDIAAAVDRGLFGGIVVRDPRRHDEIDLEVPLFLHRLAGSGGQPVFDSGMLTAGQTFSFTFDDPGTYEYVCQLHPMLGIVRVNPTGPSAVSVAILDPVGEAPRFQPEDVSIGPGGTVTWNHLGNTLHTVTDARSTPLITYALNGRAFVGNTPTIVAESGKRIRWYVFNLDLGEQWHNFHTHGQRFRVGDENLDTRTIGPAESFVVDTVVPEVVLTPVGCDDHSDDEDEDEDEESKPKHGDHDPQRYCLRGDFLVHCHVEMHMMHGMVAVVRAIQDVELDEDDLAALGFDLPVASDDYCELLGHTHGPRHGHGPGHGGGGGHGHGGIGIGIEDDCPEVHHPCRPAEQGEWEQIPDLDLFIVHAAVLHTGKVLLWSGTAEVGDPLESRVWDPVTDVRTPQAYNDDLFCSGHAFLPDGRLCVAGGAPSGILRSTHIFDPATEAWTKVSDMHQARWYPTVLTLGDGRILAVSGSGADEVEIYDAGSDTWTLVAGATRSFPELYPSLHLLPSGQIFYSRAGWAPADTADTRSAYLTLAAPAAGTWTPQGQQQFFDRQEGTSIIQIDATVSPPTAHVFVIGGGVYGAATARNPQSIERIDLTTLTTATEWDSPPLTMNHPRTNVNTVALPDGKILVVGGQRAGKWEPDPQPVLEAEIFDPATGTFAPTPPMAFPRQYHSIAALLPDGRVLTAGGIDPANPVQRDQRSMEIYRPPYLSAGPRPTISNAPTSATYASTITIDTPDAADIQSVVLIRPNSVTHHTDAGHRIIKIPILVTAAASIDVAMPSSSTIAPPGYYMIFLVNGSGAPSVARFVQLQ